MGVFARLAVVPPQTVRLDLGDDHWVEIKRELNYGEMQQVASATRSDLTTAALHLVAAYLVAWSLVDAAGAPLPLDTETERLAALRALSTEAFVALEQAIATHAEGVTAAKKGEARSGKRKSART